jgi:hypothetical protein
MKKNITAKQHADALVRLMQVTSNATNEYLAIDNDNNISQTRKDAIAKHSLKAIIKQREIFDAIDKVYNAQKQSW